MSEKAPRNNAHCTIPDDPDQSTYRFIIVAAKRGLVKYSLTGEAPQELAPEEAIL